jgi:hypothetical protein
MIMSNYTSWPSGKLPLEFQRPEIQQLQERGYTVNDARDAVDIFESKVAEFAGVKYLNATGTITIPSRCYVSIPQHIIHAGCQVEFEDIEWSGVYQLKPYPVYDGATRWQRGMYKGGFHVVSFQIKKRIPIGRGGMILTDDSDAYRWLKKASYDGRDLAVPQWEDDYEIMGWHYYMTPEDAARGIMLMDQVPEYTEDCGSHKQYSDLSEKTLFKK